VNPEHFDNLKTTSTVWTLIDPNGNTVTFKVPCNDGEVTITNGGRDAGFIVSREDARKHWNDYMNNEYRISNRCTNYDKEYDIYEEMHRICDGKDIHENDLTEMRIDPKRFYKEMLGRENHEYRNYALEA
tara:strand:- start:4743 stop:5132 length:390 start_codon:yes stop_codon:yes gene_type:complete